MNREFMKFMCQHYKHVIKDKLNQQFGSSIVSPEPVADSAGASRRAATVCHVS